MRIIRNILITLVILIGLAVTAIYFSINPLIEKTITTVGSNVLETNVNVAKVDFSPFNGNLTIKGLSVANPAGFSTGNAIYLGEATIKIDKSSIPTNKIIIEKIIIDSPEINIVGKPGSTNLATLKNTITGEKTASIEQPTTKNSNTVSASNNNQKVEIKYFSFKNGKVSASFEGLANTKSVDLPTIEMHNIGQDNNADATQAFEKIIIEVIKVSQRTALSGAGFEGQLENLKSELKEKTKDIRKNIINKLKGFNF